MFAQLDLMGPPARIKVGVSGGLSTQALPPVRYTANRHYRSPVFVNLGGPRRRRLLD